MQRIYVFRSNSGRIRNFFFGFAHYLQKYILFSAGRFVKRPYDNTITKSPRA